MSLVLLLCGLGALTGPTSARAQIPLRPDTTRTDSAETRPSAWSDDSLATPDSLAPSEPGGDSVSTALGADTTTVDTALIQRYVPSRRRPLRLFERTSPFVAPTASNDGPTVTLDSTGMHYRVENPPHTDGPMRLALETYRRARQRATLRENWMSLAQQRQQEVSRGGLGVNMVVPGGRQSTFSTIFGKPQVDLRVNGQADIKAGFQYSKNDQQGARTGDATQVDPNFKQDLRLGVTGTIGDKLQINVDWDTNNQFDYQNQVKLEYTGYEDDIVQKVEAGNVSLETPSQLISGGQSLFGIKSEFQLGNLSLTTIASQQEGQSNSLSIEGGSEKTEFNLKPTNYDEDTHYFVGYYFRNNWNRAHRDPTTITLSDGFSQVTDIEVWKLRTSSGPNESDVRRAAAVVDLGEDPALVRRADAYTSRVLPTPERDQYDDADLSALRDGETSVTNYVSSASDMEQPLGSQDVVDGDFKRLEQGRDYRINRRLGFLSLKQRLRPNEALAVAYRYRANGEVRTVGDFSGDQGGTGGGINADRLVLKLLRPPDPVAPGTDTTADPAAWFLEMRNIYRLRGRGFDQSSFELDIEYNPSGQGATTTIPAVGGQTPLLQVLGLDRINENGARTPDNQFDFTPQTINADEGLLYFPYLQPFGARILEVAEQNGTSAQAESFAFSNLYLKKKANAKKEDREKNVYSISGSYKGEAKGFYDLEAFAGLVEGSVEVTAGGQTLQEGADYVVDYQSGTVNITNQSYLSAGRTIDISYEQNSIASLQQKTLLGARADWSLKDKYSIGATIMRLSEQSPVDKYRVGEEPIKNMIWGANGSMDLKPRWLTQAVDALPLVQTRAESRLSVSGEFAQLRPGHTRTEAYQRTVEEVGSSDRDAFAADERNGLSYVDDFEGFENTFSLKEQLTAWQVSAAPDSIADTPQLGGDAPEGALARSYWRGRFGWYQLNEKIKEQLRGKTTQRGDPEATRLLDIREVFDRDTRGTGNSTLRTLDVHFNPWARGPYNYTPALEEFIDTPTRVWGGMTRRMPEGYTDFSVQNVEFVEFIVKVYPQNEQVTDGAKLFIDLGTISEDVVPDQRINTEDGLSTTFNPSELGELARIAGSPSQNGAINIRNGRTEDLGLDGLVSYTGGDGPYDPQLLETNFYSDFVGQADSLRSALGQLGLSEAERRRLRAELARVQDDPSADDYHYYEDDRYFGDEALFPRGATLQQRFGRYFAGQELNGFETQNQLAEDVSLRRGVSRTPDTEDLDGTGGSVNTVNNYYEYAIPLDELDARARSNRGATDYVVSKVGEQKDWYKVRIPVENPTRVVGNIQDFTRIQSIRMWTTGHAAPVTMRFASFELVGSQWRASNAVAEQPVKAGRVPTEGQGELRVASVNNEEDPAYEPPVGAIVSRSRTSRGSRRRNREQALLLGLNELEPGRQRGIFKSFNQGLDLLKYSNLRMYTHVHGASNSPQAKEAIRKNLRLFVRIGANESSDYYEYTQPMTPNDVPGSEGSERLWLEENEMNLVLSALSQLKTARDQSPVPPDSVFTSVDAGLSLPFAREGTTLKMRGTPSLNRISTVVVGVRHAGQPTQADPLRNVELWVNELRVSGYDERAGWAANANASMELADLATLEGSFQRQTDGFGALNSSLGERESAGNTSWNARAEVNLDALLPQQQGWRIPVTMQVQSSLTEPRFDPERGDIRIGEIQSLFENLSPDTLQSRFGNRYPGQSTSQIREALKDSVRRASQSYNLRRTVTANLSKQESESWWLRQTLDATSMNFSYFDRQSRSPQQSINRRWNWSGQLRYELDFGRPQTIQPFGFLPDVPLLEALGGVAFNYVPTSLSFVSGAERTVSTTQSRLSSRRDRSLPARIASPFRESQDFTHQRRFSLQYNPFGFLNLSFDTNTQQSLSEIASRTQTNLVLSDRSAVGKAVVPDVGSPAAFFENPSSFLPNTPEADQLTADSLGTTIFVEDRLQPRSEWAVFQDLFFGGATPRTNRYRQRFNATLSIGLLDRQTFNWIDLRDVNYQSSFDWRNGSQGSLTGATARNQAQLRTGVSLRPARVWERFEFFRRMKEAQRAGDESGARRSGEEENAPSATSDGEDDNDEADEAGWDAIPLPDPVGLLRGLALTLMDIEDITVNYTSARTSTSSNVGDLRVTETDTTVLTRHSLLDAVQGEGPPLGYRFGLGRSIATGSRVFPEGQRVFDNLSDEHELEGRTTLSPGPSLQVDLNWTLQWSEQSEITFRRPRPDSLRRSRTERGDVRASVWAFGGYGSLFEAQLSTLRSAIGADPDGPRAAGDVPLTNASVAADFREAYLTGGGLGVANGLAPFPMPGWTIRYSGLSDWPLLRSVTKGVSLNHGYNAEYQSGYARSNLAGEPTSLRIGGTPFEYRRAEFELGTQRVQEQFSPLIGLDVTWPGDLETNVEWSRRVTTSLRTASLRIAEKKTSELAGQVAYSARGFSIPLLPIGRIENRVRFSLTLSRQVNDEREYSLRPPIEQAAGNSSFTPDQAQQGDNVSIVSQTTRLTVTPQVSYSISNRVTADFTLEYEKFDGDSRRPSFTNVNGSFNVQVNISEN